MIDKFDLNFEANTPVEMVLLGKIRQLEYQMELLQHEKGLGVSVDKNQPIELHSKSMFATISLPYTARVHCAVDNMGKLEIFQSVHFKDNPKQFGMQYFVDPEPMNKYQAADMLNMLHRRNTHMIAEFLTTK